MNDWFHTLQIGKGVYQSNYRVPNNISLTILCCGILAIIYIGIRVAFALRKDRLDELKKPKKQGRPRKVKSDVPSE